MTTQHRANELLHLHEAVTAERAASPPTPWKMVNPAELGAPKSEAEMILDSAPERPIETAARERARVLGLEAAIAGGISEMQDVWSAVAAHNDRAASWLDKAWDMLVAADGRWVA